ncbi:MAG: hypothetical protein DI628_05895 [Blastochloris viridis]|uniref:Uncharacterized protein n=1 Tax=Blastochloris viridis TaxID=1079 RepID=A0A6N4R9G0_BLAVI|nr:MAG: hypothetical protein DI628_05895 [Blastochloris viridis]
MRLRSFVIGSLIVAAFLTFLNVSQNRALQGRLDTIQTQLRSLDTSYEVKRVTAAFLADPYNVDKRVCGSPNALCELAGKPEVLVIGTHDLLWEALDASAMLNASGNVPRDLRMSLDHARQALASSLGEIGIGSANTDPYGMTIDLYRRVMAAGLVCQQVKTVPCTGGLPQNVHSSLIHLLQLVHDRGPTQNPYEISPYVPVLEYALTILKV